MASATNFYAGLDIGTSSTKVLIVNDSAEPVFKTSRSYGLSRPRPGYAEQDPDELCDAILDSLREAIQRLEPDQRLRAIGISSAMHSFLLVDRNGHPTTPLITWADTRSEHLADSLKRSDEGRSIYQQTGTPIHPMSPLCKGIWFRERAPENLDRAYKLISIKEYLLWKLYGRYVVDHSIASATGFFSLRDRTWHQPALDLIGIDGSQLSEPVSTTYILEDMEPSVQENLGLTSSIPVVIGASDGCLANLGVFALSPDEAALTIGTSGAVRVTTQSPSVDPQERLFTYILDDTHYVVGGAINNGGITLEWFKNQLLKGAEHEELNIEALLAQTRNVPPGSEGLLCLPYLLGERAPHWNSFDKGVFFGVQFHHTTAHFLKAMMEGISMTLFQIAKAMQELCEPVRILYANGGFVRSKEWLQIVADVFGTELIVSPTREASATGAALLAMRALNVPWPDPSREQAPAGQDCISPNPDHHNLYLDSTESLASLYEKLHPDFVHRP